jgi:hexosaminidase
MMGWNEIMGGHFTGNDSIDSKTAHQLSPNVIVHFWTGDPGIVNDAVTRGYDVVNSFYEFTYLDYTYETTPLQKAYGFDPVPASLPPALQNKILGLGCQIWSEWIPTVERMNYQIYPRIAAHAETGWTLAENKDYSRFLAGMKNSYLMDRWKGRKISFSPEQF